MEEQRVNRRIRRHPLPSIGGFTPENPFFLAPMAGVTDAVMRQICHEMGASLTYSEMVSAKALCFGDRKTRSLLEIAAGGGPTAFQIFGHEPDVIARAAEILAPYPNVILDINMGCPVPKIVKNGDGSALMKDPKRAAEIVRAAKETAGKPVTVKIRAGFTEQEKNAVEIAQAVCEAGCDAVAVHGRTRSQFYSGNADRKIIAAVKRAATVPVIGNGDVTDVCSAERMFQETGCDFVMVARAARGNPWIFRELAAAWEGREAAPPTMTEKKECLKRQMRELAARRGEYAAVREMRKTAGWYLRGMPGSAALRNKINQVTDLGVWYQMVDDFFREDAPADSGLPDGVRGIK